MPCHARGPTRQRSEGRVGADWLDVPPGGSDDQRRQEGSRSSCGRPPRWAWRWCLGTGARQAFLSMVLGPVGTSAFRFDDEGPPGATARKRAMLRVSREKRKTRLTLLLRTGLRSQR